MKTIHQWQTVNPRSYNKPTVLCIDFGHSDGKPRFCIVGCDYGYLYTSGGDIRTWLTRSGANKVKLKYQPL